MEARSVKEFRTQQGIFEAHVPADVLGKGTYGTVFRVRSRTDPTLKKAIKIFVPETMDENEGVPSTTLREVNAVKTVNHPNVMSVEEVVIPTNSSVTEMFIVMELCRGTLKEKIQDMICTYLKSDPKWLKPTPGMTLPNDYVVEAKLVAWQILNAVAVCHSRGIMHRDLKPANILWSFDELLKIGDFGLARFVRGNPISEDHLVPQTGEVQTMWYRAPEVLLGDERYGMLVDDWSLGCVIAELFRFRMSNANKRMEPDPLFAGRGDVHTLLLIFEALGTPFHDEYLRELSFWSSCFPKWAAPGTLRQKIKLIDDAGFDLIKHLLHPSPKERKASRFLLNHPWFNDVRDIINSKFIPWYRGYEEDYLRLLEIDRMPDARPLPLPMQSRNETTTAAGSESRPESAASQRGVGAKKKRDRSTSSKNRDQENKGVAPNTQSSVAVNASRNPLKRNVSVGSRASSKSGATTSQPQLAQAKIAVKVGTTKKAGARRNEDVNM